MQEAGISYDPDRVIWYYTEDRKVHPYEGIYQMIGNHYCMDAVVCYNDQIAIQVIQALNDGGLKVPEDVSVTGYDNSYMTNINGLKLTSIIHPQEKLGEMAAELMLKLIQNGSDMKDGKRILIEPEIVEGNSCTIKNSFGA